ncbi:hypothetical protein A8H39_00375 [Paraburkholderia fungorum]|nr:hypothetical protein A8H39_00375 [Paraburkholderia fungorum]
MDLQNNRVYPTRDIENWLSESAGLTRGSRAWSQTLKAARQTLVDGEAYFFERVSDTHFRVHRADAEGVRNVMRILDEATATRSQRLWLIALACLSIILCLGGAIGLVTTLVRHFVLHAY